MCPFSGFMPKTASWMNILVCCTIVTPFPKVNSYIPFEGTQCLHLQGHEQCLCENLKSRDFMHFIEFGIAFGGLLWSVLIIVCGLSSLLSHIPYKVSLYVPQIFVCYKSLAIQKNSRICGLTCPTLWPTLVQLSRKPQDLERKKCVGHKTGVQMPGVRSLG